MIIMDGFKLAAVCLFCIVVGYVLSYLMSLIDNGWRPFSKTRIVRVDPSDPKCAVGIQIGVIAGYFAATGEDKPYGEIVENYLEMLQSKNIK